MSPLEQPSEPLFPSEQLSSSKQQQPICIAITGASGVQYGLTLTQTLVSMNIPVYLMISQAARVVIATETELKLPGSCQQQADYLSLYFDTPSHLLKVFNKTQWLTPPASGSGKWQAMVICPCSTGTLSAVAQGASNNLIERAADVALKERKPLILVPREAPYSRVHLDNMLKITDAGGIILPASPGFYHQPQTIDDLIRFMVARILNLLHIDHQLLPEWGESDRNSVTVRPISEEEAIGDKANPQHKIQNR